MFTGASERERLVPALGAWAGLRRREIGSLTVGDVRMTLDKPLMNVTRKGGVKKDVPISKAVLNAIRPYVLGKPPEARVYPNGYACIQRDVEALGRIVGSRVSCHNLRRSFGRNLYKRGVDVNRIRAHYNHVTSEIPLYNIGETLDGMREAVELFDPLRPLPAAPILGV